MDFNAEYQRLRDVYTSRPISLNSRYSLLSRYHLFTYQTRLRLLCQFLGDSKSNIGERRAFELGFGYGENLLDLIRIGFKPSNISGCELMHDRFISAKSRIPADAVLSDVDFLSLSNPGLFDIVIQSTVFSSVLTKSMRGLLANKMLSILSDSGVIIWYDMVVSNPWNKDLSGISINEIKQLFPGCSYKFHRVTVPPPVGRLLIDRFRIPPFFVQLLPIRSHILAFITKAN